MRLSRLSMLNACSISNLGHIW
ncbi:hypothetical protein RDABS01_021059 [Bienertia sinuspersici]